MPESIESTDNARYAVIGAAILTFALYLIPYGQYVIYPLLLFSTFVHEMGHGIAAIFMGGSFHQFQMWANGSGVAQHSGHYGAFARAFISAGGLLGPAVMGGIFFVLGRKPFWARLGLGLFAAGSLLSVLLFVRNGFGIVFVLLVALILGAIARFAGERAARFVMLFLAIELSLTVFSRGDYLFMQYAETSAGQLPSDTQQIANALGGPYWLWGAIVGAISVAIVVWGAWTSLKRDKHPSPAKG